MTLIQFRRATDDETLLRRTRRGDMRARRAFVRRHAERAVEIVDLLVGDRYDVTPLTARVLDVALADSRAFDEALVRAAVRVCAPLSTDFGRLVLALTDVEAWTEEAVADLLDLPVAEVSELRASARNDAGVASSVRSDCRGWRLVAVRERATEPERRAGEAHLALCRSCRRRAAEQRQAREKLTARGAAATAVVAADVVALAVPTGGAASAAGIASAIFSKAGVAGVGAAAVAVTIASAGVAAARQNAPAGQPHQHSTRPAVTRTSGPAPDSVPGTAPVGTSAPQPSRSGASAPGRSAPLPVPSVSTPDLVLPTLPTLPTTTLVPLPIPTLPTLLPEPTLSPLPLPLPTASVPALPLPTVPLPATGTLLGH